MVCDSCGSTSPEGSKFCIHCGASLTAREPGASSSPPAAPPPPPPPFVPDASPVRTDADDDVNPVPEQPTPGEAEEPAEQPATTARVHPPPVAAPPPPPPIEAPPPPPVVPSSVPPPPPPIPTAPPTPPSAAAPPPPLPEPEELAPPEPESPIGIVDPSELAPAVARLSANAQRAGRVAAAVLSALLHEGERVQALVQGLYQGHAAVGVLTNERVLLVNDHEWRPDVREIALTAELVVQGWQDDRTASLVFVTEGQSVTLSTIVDRPLAQEMAHLIRARVAELAG